MLGNKVIDAYVLMNPECKAVNVPEVWSGMSEYYDIKHHYERIEEKIAPAEEKYVTSETRYTIHSY